MPSPLTQADRRQPEKILTAMQCGRRSYYDPKHDKNVVRVLPGDHYVSRDQNEMIVTILGSCVAACIRDPETGIGGMNHFMLPESSTGNWGAVSATMRYGNFAMETLINAILKTGCPKERLEIKLFGGGNVTPGIVKVGDNNGQFALNYLKFEGLAPLAHDLGGPHARRIHYFPETGKVDRLLLKRSDDAVYLKEENEYRVRLPGAIDAGGEVDLF
ncbi:chemoreceptor glutamine deamidase CheD [Sneathiella sp.]|jgi:chemotaxis protein CheD|uniref:chemoreceptor glutamine deamidase CheD n=1 Tax=Sneathiella sp. TaxID=1964365 RepID=UPI0039E3594A